jgi:hypothetical protein
MNCKCGRKRSWPNLRKCGEIILIKKLMGIENRKSKLKRGKLEEIGLSLN